jgi:hypothetical protein
MISAAGARERQTLINPLPAHPISWPTVDQPVVWIDIVPGIFGHLGDDPWQWLLHLAMAAVLGALIGGSGNVGAIPRVCELNL